MCGSTRSSDRRHGRLEGQPLLPSSLVADHLVALPGTEWRVWREACLRTTAFPAAGLGRLAAVHCAEVADAHLDKQADADEFAKAFADAESACSREVHDIAGDALFREAVTWQNRSALIALDRVRAAGPQPHRLRKHRERERVIARYWQRYCAKAETIGFFGPVCWVTIDPDGSAVVASPGPALTRDRRVFLEHWALSAYADHVAAKPRARRWFPPVLHPHLRLRGRSVLDPARPPHRLSAAEAAVLARCDGRRTASAVAAQAVSAGVARTEEDVFLLLDGLVKRGLVRWNLDLPVHLDCERMLRERILAIGDADVRSDALAGLDALCLARDQVADAAGDPAALAAALERLDQEFTAVTGQPPARRPGQMYAGRTLCGEETNRDLDITIGGPVLAAIAAPLAVVLRAARWLTVAMAEAYQSRLRGLFDELAADLGSDRIPLDGLWFLAQGLFYGTGDRPADAVAAELSRRWQELFGLSNGDTGVHRVSFTAAELMAAAAELFPADRPGWSAARLHSPDLHLCARDAAAIGRGEFTVVLGELHVAWATNTCGVFVSGHQEPDRLRAALVADLGSGRIHPLLPLDWPRYSARLAFALEDSTDIQLGILPAPGADPDRVVAAGDLTVWPAAEPGSEAGGELMVSTPDGRGRPLAEAFSRLLSEVAVEAFKLTGLGGHTPRLSIDQMVVSRETWRTTVGASGLAGVTGDDQRYLAARRWRRAIGLPEQVFIKIQTEVKPLFVDFTSPLYVASLAAMLRSAQAAHGDQVTLTVTEMLPTADQAWVPDTAGRGYLSELRLQIVDAQWPWPGRQGQE